MTEETYANVPPPIEFRTGLAGRIGVAIAVCLMAALTVAVLVLTGPAWSESAALGLVMAGVGLALASLTAYCAKEAVARQRLGAEIYAGRLTARLPNRRGYIASDKQTLDVPLSNIERILTRIEHFESIGVATGQRAYRLVLRDGREIDLGADREMMPPFFGPLVEAIARGSNAPVEDRGAVDGKAGFLLVAGQSAPDWDTPPLPEDVAALKARKRKRAPGVIGIAILVAIIVRHATSR